MTGGAARGRLRERHASGADTGDRGDLLASDRAFYERAGGFFVPLAATVLAFLIGGLVVLITGHNPITAYRAIFEGAGFNWPYAVAHGTGHDERRGAISSRRSAPRRR